MLQNGIFLLVRLKRGKRVSVALKQLGKMPCKCPGTDSLEARGTVFVSTVCPILNGVAGNNDVGPL